jgi:hypothetical protein
LWWTPTLSLPSTSTLTPQFKHPKEQILIETTERGKCLPLASKQTPYYLTEGTIHEMLSNMAKGQTAMGRNILF